MEIEKEYRYKVTDEQIQRIKQISNVIDEKSEQIDLTLGYDGFNSLNKYGNNWKEYGKLYFYYVREW